MSDIDMGEVLHLKRGQAARLELFREWCKAHPRSSWPRGGKYIRRKYRYAPRSVVMSAIWREVQAEVEAAKPPKREAPPKRPAMPRKPRAQTVEVGPSVEIGESAKRFEALAMRQANALERIANAVETLMMDKLTAPAQPLTNGAARICETVDEAAS